MGTMRFWKYKWKTIEEVAKQDPWYTSWFYWETICNRFGDDWWEKACEIEKYMIEAWYDIYYEAPKRESQYYKEIVFWKYKWRTFEFLVKKDAKYLWYIYNQNKSSDKQNKKLQHTILYWIKKNGCIMYDEKNTKKWLQYCRWCDTMHNK